MTALQNARAGMFALLVSLTLSAHADDDCDRPVADWQSRGAVQALAQRNGWQIDKLKIDDGCYEIKGRDADGQHFKAKLDPATLEVVSIKRKHQSHDRERARQRNGAAPAGDAPRSKDQSQDDLNPGEHR